MKRGTVEHPKMFELAKLLGVEHCTAVGIMESLWHITAKYAQQGNIGKFTNSAIAEQLHWTGDPDRLVGALCRARWLDICPANRLLVHDWKDHCEQTVTKWLARHNLDFLTVQTSTAIQKDSQMDSLPLPLPKPMPAPRPEPAPQATAGGESQALTPAETIIKAMAGVGVMVGNVRGISSQVEATLRIPGVTLEHVLEVIDREKGRFTRWNYVEAILNREAAECAGRETEVQRAQRIAKEKWG